MTIYFSYMTTINIVLNEKTIEGMLICFQFIIYKYALEN
jgi:hypothetical protein